MKLEIQEKKDNPLIGRQEISFSVTETKATPSRKELRETIAAQTNSEEKNIIVDVLDTRFGTTDLKGEARIYENEKQLKKIELKPIVVRNFGKEEKKAEATPEGEEAKPEAPAEKAEEKPAAAEAQEKKEESLKKGKEATEGSPEGKAKEEGKEKPQEEKKE